MEQQSVMVDGLRLLILAAQDFAAHTSGLKSMDTKQSRPYAHDADVSPSARRNSSETRHLHAFQAVEHYWQTHMHLVEDAFHEVNTRHRYGGAAER